MICAQKKNNDEFFVANSNGSLKIGYSLDITGKTGAPVAFVLGWQFSTNDGALVELPTPPQDILQKVAKKMAESTLQRFSGRF